MRASSLGSKNFLAMSHVGLTYLPYSKIESPELAPTQKFAQVENNQYLTKKHLSCPTNHGNSGFLI